MAQLLDPEVLDFIQSDEVAMCLAGCTAQRQPRATRAFHCRLHPDGHHLVVWIAQHNAELLSGIDHNGRVALVVAHVATFRSMQFKGLDARVLPVDPADYTCILQYREGFIRNTNQVGHREDVMRMQSQFRVDQLAAIHFTPTAAFTQTPGPAAGSRLPLGSSTGMSR